MKKLVLPVVLAAVLLAVIIFLSASPSRTIAQDTPPETDAVLDGNYLCTISELAVFPSRMHVKCSGSVTVGSDLVSYFAFPSTSANALMSNRYMTLLNTAYALGHPVRVYFDDNAASNPPGCGTTNCRLLNGLQSFKP